MKNLAEIVTENKSKGEWCLWDYTENGVREILVWKGDGKDQSDVTEIDKDGYELMNVDFKESFPDYSDDDSLEKCCSKPVSHLSLYSAQ